MRAQDDGALAGATDTRPSTSIKRGVRPLNPLDFHPPPRRNLLCHLLRSFPSRWSSGRLISTTCIRRGSRSEQRFKIVTNPSRCSSRDPLDGSRNEGADLRGTTVRRGNCLECLVTGIYLGAATEPSSHSASGGNCSGFTL